MSVANNITRFSYTGNGVLTAFAMTNSLVYDSAHVQVYLDSVLQGAGYTVTGIADAAGATVTFTTAPASGVKILLLRVVPFTQLSVYAVAGAFPAKTTEKNLDLATMQAQQLNEVDARTLKIPVGSLYTPSLDIPDPNLAANQGKVLRLTATGIDVVAVQTTDFANPLTTKGDLVVRDATAAVRLPVGTDNLALAADATDGKGLGWRGGSSAKSAAYTVVRADHQKVFKASTTFTLTLTAAATLGDAFQIYVINVGTGIVTIDPTGAETIDGATVFALGPSDSVVVFCDGANFHTTARAMQGSKVSDFRLTLETLVPISTTDQTARTTIYFTPYTGQRIDLYVGARWVPHYSAEISIAVPATTVTMYDIWVFSNAGVPALEVLAWTNDTTRATAIARQDGVWTKSGDATRRYVGSFRTTGVSGQTEDSLAKRHLWNYYHRAPRAMRVQEATDSWTYSTALFRQANGSTANQLDFIIGVSEDSVSASVHAMSSNNTATVRNVRTAVGLDSVTAFAAGCFPSLAGVDTSRATVMTSIYTGYPSIGRHFLAWLEYGAGADTQTWFGDNADPTILQLGIQGTISG